MKGGASAPQQQAADPERVPTHQDHSGGGGKGWEFDQGKWEKKR